MKTNLAVSNRHVHVTSDVWEKLFGNKSIEIRNYLKQPGQFASTSTVDIKVGSNIISHVRVVGPFRKYNQVEVSLSDAKMLNVCPPRRQSGELDGSLPVILIGPCGEVKLDKGLIMAECHIHMSVKMANDYNLVDKQIVDVYKDDNFIMNSKIKISDDAYLEMHIDKDEEILYDLHNGDLVDIKLCGK